MPETVIVALIAGGSSLLGVLVANHSSRKKVAVEQARRDQRIDDRLDRLEKKVDEYNDCIKRFGEFEKAIVRIDTTLSERMSVGRS